MSKTIKTTPKPKRVLLIDGDVLVYKVAFGSEVPIDWGDGLHTLHADADACCLRMDGEITKLVELLDADDVVVALTDSGANFRKEIAPTYKENRNANRKPLVWGAMRRHLLENHAAMVRPNLEADDVLGILATKAGPVKAGLPAVTEKIIVSIDKDFQSIPGKFFNMDKPEEGILEFSPAQAEYFHLYQTLIGDSTDNYPGCPGVGPKKAVGILGEEGTYEERLKGAWSRVVAAYDKAGLSEQVAITQARLARILRACDYNFKTKTPILWEAPKA